MIDDQPARTGPLAFGLACGAQFTLDQGAEPGGPWSDLAGAGSDGAGSDRAGPRRLLARRWAVHGPGEWRRAVDGLLAERGRRPTDRAMDLRWRATVVRTVPPDLAGWQRIIRRAVDPDQRGGPEVASLRTAAERVSRYEDQFRADGLISPHGVVHSVRAHDWCRAVDLARWGRLAGYGDRAAAEQAVLRVGELCARHYMSWPDLAAAVALGRLLALADHDVAARYPAIRHTLRALLTEPASPWRTTPWPALSLATDPAPAPRS